MLTENEKAAYRKVLVGYESKTMVQLCLELGLRPGRLASILKELKLLKPPAVVSRMRVDIERKVFEEAARTCPTVSDMCLRFGVSNRVIHRLRKLYGVELPSLKKTGDALAAQGLRRCCICKMVKRLTEDFHALRANVHGRDMRCKQCQATAAVYYAQLRKERETTGWFLAQATGEPVTRKCKGCGQWRLRDTEFERNPDKKGQWLDLCVDCMANQRNRAAIRWSIEQLEATGKRRCCRCHQIKSLTEDFPKNRLARLGRNHACLACVSRDNRLRAAQTPDRLARIAAADAARRDQKKLEESGFRQCSCCGKTKDLLMEFCANQSCRRGREISCRECAREKRRERAERTPAGAAKGQARRTREALERSGQRQCSRCGETKNLMINFRPADNCRHGRFTICKVCEKRQREQKVVPTPARLARAEARRALEAMESSGQRRCVCCKEIKNLQTQFGRAFYGRLSRNHACLECSRRTNRQSKIKKRARLGLAMGQPANHPADPAAESIVRVEKDAIPSTVSSAAEREREGALTENGDSLQP